jgi:hypothetical protein
VVRVLLDMSASGVQVYGKDTTRDGKVLRWSVG